ncbi:tetratricopeptide repeat protein [Paenibacillus athensensis]|uniref:tetratricopeptide repeat protein n=1 Tax=Paenibacillus athensensis TaxID=1967502 RepID=UPI0014309C85|nr:tetratricopeptide repeat protein [Paenibacillus athensensis]MCD1261044.1 tetratricopeptide repeat protein [Paenibacillus athensensis]
MEQRVSGKASALLIAGTAVLLCGIGAAVGYSFFWNQYDTATSSQKRATQLEEQAVVKPNDTNNQLELGWTYYEQGKYEQALEQFDQAYKAGQSADAKYGIANAYMGLQRYAEAEKLLADLVETSPDNDAVLHDLGVAEREQGQYADAESHFKRALELNYLSADLYYDAGLLYEKMNKPQQAIAHYEKCVDFVPDYAEARAGLKRLGVDAYEPKKFHETAQGTSP